MDLLASLEHQSDQIKSLAVDVTTLQADATKTGVQVRAYHFNDKMEIKVLLEDKAIDAKAFSAAINLVSLFCHYQDSHSTSAIPSLDLNKIRDTDEEEGADTIPDYISSCNSSSCDEFDPDDANDTGLRGSASWDTKSDSDSLMYHRPLTSHCQKRSFDWEFLTNDIIDPPSMLYLLP